MKKLFVTAVLLLGSTVFADQCNWVTKNQAERAARILAETERVQSYCEPCGVMPSYMIIPSVRIQKTEDIIHYQVIVGKKAIDLAYTYVNGLNLAKLVGCPTQDVSSAID